MAATASTAASTSSSVVNTLVLNRTVPPSCVVPSAWCISGAHWIPARTWIRWVAVEHGGHHTRIDARQADADDTQLSACVARTVHRDPVDLRQPVQQPRRQRLGVLTDLLEPQSAPDRRSPRPVPSTAGTFRLPGSYLSGNVSGWRSSSLCVPVPPCRSGSNCASHSGGNVQHAQTRRSQQPFVGRSCQQVRSDPRHVDRQVAQRLGRVHQVEHAVFGRDSAHFLDRLQRAGDVRGVDQRNQPRVGAERSPHGSGSTMPSTDRTARRSTSIPRCSIRNRKGRSTEL